MAQTVVNEVVLLERLEMLSSFDIVPFSLVENVAVKQGRELFLYGLHVDGSSRRG